MQMGRIVSNNFIKSAIRITILFLGVVSFSINAANTMAPGWNSLGGDPGTGAAITASRTQSPGMSANFTLSGFSSTRVVFNNENWQSISFPNQCVTDVIGAPALPLLRRYFAVPKNATVTVEVINVVFETFENVKIEPFQRPLLETEKPEDREFAIDENLYKTDRFYPQAWASASESVIMHSVRMGIMKVNPFRYNPMTGTLQAASKITCKVTYSNFISGTQTFPSHLTNTFKALLLNFDFMEYRSIPSRSKRNLRQATDYLFIVDPDFMSNAGLQSLADLYTGQGYTVEMKDASSLSGSSAIKDYLQSLYDEGELDYALFVGDLPAIPHYKTRLESDSWYTWLDGSDKVGDIGLGRMPATDETELNYMVTKTLNFQTGAEPGEWRNKSVLIAHKQDYPGKYTACKEDIYEHNYTLEAPVMDRLYGGENATNNQVTDAINEGRLVVNYRGHGSSTAWTGWCGSSYSTSAVNNLANGKKTPIVYCMACTNGKLSSSSHCLAEAFLCQEQGAVWALAATTTSSTSVNHHYDRGLYYGAWDEGIEAVGDLRNYADAHALEQSGSSANSNITMYVCFGDPLINILVISTIKYIATTSPDNGAEVEQNTTFNITWGDNIDGNVKIELLKAGSVVEEIAGSTESDGLFEWNIPGNMATGSDYKMKITSIDSSALFSESNGMFSITEEYIIATFPFIEDFEKLDSGMIVLPKKWIQSEEDDFNWLVLSGPPPSKQYESTGPDGDHTTGSGKYIYMEASNPNNPDKKAYISTPKFGLTNTAKAELTFYYHMFSDSNHMGELALDIEVDGNMNSDIVKLTEDAGDEWKLQTVDLTPYIGERVIFHFRGVTGESWCSDICIDDFKIDPGTQITNPMVQSPVYFDLKYNGSKIYFQVPDNGNNVSHVSVELYNLQGKMIRRLVNGNVKAGYHSISLDKINHTGNRIAVGTYLCRMETKDFTKTIKILFKK